MGLQEFIIKIKHRENRFYNFLYWSAKNTLILRVPVIKPLHLFLYYERSVRRTTFGIIKKMLYTEPLFRARCDSVGDQLILIDGIPLISGNLRIRIGNSVTLHGVTSLTAGHVYPDPTLDIGDFTFVGYGVSIRVAQRVQIGKYCKISDRCVIADNNGHPLDMIRRCADLPVDPSEVHPVIIEDGVWIGTCAVILKGVTIGKGSIIGAGSVVTKSIPPHCIAAGNPACVVKKLGPEHVEEVSREKLI